MPKRRRKAKELLIASPDLSILTSDRDIYRTLASKHILSYRPPMHWFHSIPTFICSPSDNPSSESNQSKKADQCKVSAHLNGLANCLNELKSKLITYCEILTELKAKRSIHTNPQNEFRRASRNGEVNPFETLYIEFDDSPLISRSALKLCNIDALTLFCICPASAEDGEEQTFVDLCGAPGGFAQYLLFRGMKGYGMSLSGNSEESVGVEWNVGSLSDDFKVHGGIDGTGNIYSWENVTSLRQKIAADTGRSTVSLVVADGGIDAQRNSTNQEAIAHKLVTCQIASALLLLRPGGNFVIKMFGFQTSRTKAVMQFMLGIFHKIQVLKPITSRPASAERYVVFHSFKGLIENFDLLKWRDATVCADNEVSTKKIQLGLSYFLDSVDHEMLSLNYRACANIVEYLRAEEEKISGKIGKSIARKNRIANDDLNLDYIKNEWRIPSSREVI